MGRSAVVSRLEVRPCSAADLSWLLRTTWRGSLRAHHRERYAWQQAGEAVYLLAWEG